jgi:hypothetical protein
LSIVFPPSLQKLMPIGVRPLQLQCGRLRLSLHYARSPQPVLLQGFYDRSRTLSPLPSSPHPFSHHLLSKQTLTPSLLATESRLPHPQRDRPPVHQTSNPSPSKRNSDCFSSIETLQLRLPQAVDFLRLSVILPFLCSSPVFPSPSLSPGQS